MEKLRRDFQAKRSLEGGRHFLGLVISLTGEGGGIPVSLKIRSFFLLTNKARF